jgi:hypothetical protein
MPALYPEPIPSFNGLVSTTTLKLTNTHAASSEANPLTVEK